MRIGRILIVAGVLFVISLGLDTPVARWAHESGLAANLVDHHALLLRVLRIQGNFLEFTVPAVALLLVIPPPPRWIEAEVVLLAGVFSGINWIIKWMVGRTRPFHTSAGPWEFHPFDRGLVHGLLFRGALKGARPLSFPSGDATLAFAMAVSLGWALPRWRPLFFATAIVVGVERISENAHYPSEIVAGLALGAVVARAAWGVVQRLNRDRTCGNRPISGSLGNGGAAEPAA